MSNILVKKESSGNVSPIVSRSTMTGNETFTQPSGLLAVFFLDPNGANRTFNASGAILDGYNVIIKNTAARGTNYYVMFDSVGIAKTIYPERSERFVWDNTRGVWG